MLLRVAVRFLGSSMLVGLAMLSVGCGGGPGPRAKVSGKVTVGDKALTTGTVIFYGKNNAQGVSPIDTEGNYVINDAPMGDVTITVTVPKGTVGGKGVMGMMKPPGGKSLADQKSVDPEGSGKSIAIMGKMPSEIVPIPAKYGNGDTSGLTYKVEKGDHTHDLKLTP